MLLDALTARPGADGPVELDEDEVYDSFVGWAEAQGLSLYPAQSEALLELVSGSNVILATPTGSGKSLVATGAHYLAMAGGRRSFYTAPIKALVSEKFFALVAIFGGANVGMMTGDATVNGQAPIICCTAEVLANLALREGAASDVGLVVMDEFHYYGDVDRGWAWQVPLLELPNVQFLLMSATLGDTKFIADDLTRRTGRLTAQVTSVDRPVPLHHYYAQTPLHETIADLLETKQAPIYIVHFTQAAALEQAQALTSVNMSTRAEKDLIAEGIGDFRFSAGFGKVLSRLVRHGIGVHHAGMLPKYRRLVEQLAQAGLLKVICGTDTLGVGINVPIRTVVFTGLSKYDGTRTRHLQVREFHQIAGRAGRAGYDTAGTVVVQAPEHEVENVRLVAKAGDDPKKLKRVQRKKAPEGFVSWTSATFERLVNGVPEPLASHMRVSNSMLLNVIARPGDAFVAMRKLLTDNHESLRSQRRLVHRAIQDYRGLLTGGVIERLPSPDAEGRTVRLTVDLPPHFALNQPLSGFALAAIEILDLESETFALDVVSMIEATLDSPRQIMSAQERKARGDAIGEMKSQGIEYEERMLLLEDITYPKPLEELLDVAFEAYTKGHPWLSELEVSPKAVVREMWERAMTFGEYIAFYGLTRSEGSLLRYLSDAYRALRTGVPSAARTEAVEDITSWLGELVHQVDSSLLDEWEQLTNPDDDDTPDVVPQMAKTRPLTGNVRVFTIMVRNSLFRRVELAALRRYWELGQMDAADGFDGNAYQDAIEPYYARHSDIGTGPNARGPALLQITKEPTRWRVRQIFDDPAGDGDWGIEAEVDLDASDEAGELVMRITHVGEWV
ncbi:MAG: box helicase domain protein [Pseudonocardiales bacterium]|nr:box helicase domain protein [Pseudonocardiales bacterium]